MKPIVVHAEAERDAALPIERAIVEAAGAEFVCGAAATPEAVVAVAHDALVLLAESHSISRPIVEGLSRCQAIVTYGIGFDHIDTNAATEHGILIVNIPGFCVDEVANHTILFLLACAKKLIRLDRDLRAGHWPDSRALETALSPVGCIYGEQLGLVGFGGIGRPVAVRAKALGMKVAAHDPLVPGSVISEYGVQPMALDELIETSDYVSLHTPLMPETRRLINEDRLRRMKPTAYLVNTSRGGVVDQAALIRALQEGWIAGAGLDVFDAEPIAPDNPLLKLDNVVLTPHVASFSDASFARLRRRVGEEAARVVRGEWPTAVANPGVRGRSRLERSRGT